MSPTTEVCGKLGAMNCQGSYGNVNTLKNSSLHKPTTNSTKTTGRKICQVVITTHGETTTKVTKNIKRQIEETNIEVDEQQYDNNVDERKLPATIHNNNEEEDYDNDYEDDNNDDEDDDNSPWCSLPNCTHNDLDVPSRKEIKYPLEMKLMERYQNHQQLNIW